MSNAPISREYTDTERLDFYTKNSMLFTQLGQNWYYKFVYGGPFWKASSLRRAIDAVMSHKEKEGSMSISN